MSADTKCIGGHYCIASNGSPFFEKYLLLSKSLPIFVLDIFLSSLLFGQLKNDQNFHRLRIGPNTHTRVVWVVCAY